MRCSIHVSALAKIFLNGTHTELIPFISVSLLGVTEDILKDYSGVLDKSDLYKTWFASIATTSRFVTLNKDHKKKYRYPSLRFIHSDYLKASYYSGMDLLISDHATVQNNDSKKLDQWGIRKLDLKELKAEVEKRFWGDNPINEFHLKSKTTYSYEIATRYFSNETRVVIYDKYVSEESLSFLVAICKSLNARAKVEVITSNWGRTCKKPAEIINAIKGVLPLGSIRCNLGSAATIKEVHDRHIFIGDRIQLGFTRGLDVFGKPNAAGIMKNKEGDITMYYVVDAPFYDFILADNTKITVRKIE